MNILKKQTLLTLLLSAAVLFSVNAAAEDIADAAAADDTAVAETAADEAADELAVLLLDGKERIIVTSSDSSIPGTSEKIETSVLFDGSTNTGCTVTFIELPAPETDENGEPIADEALTDVEVATEKTLSVYTATRVPEALRTVAALFGGESGTVLAVSVYGTNDSLLMDWTQLAIQLPLSTNGEYSIIDIADEPVKYSFYRIDITLVEGSAFNLAELLLFKDAGDGTSYYYESDGEVEAGETPELIEVPAEEPAKEAEAEKPLFGLFGMPGLTRQSYPRY